MVRHARLALDRARQAVAGLGERTDMEKGPITYRVDGGEPDMGDGGGWLTIRTLPDVDTGGADVLVVS